MAQDIAGLEVPLIRRRRLEMGPAGSAIAAQACLRNCGSQGSLKQPLRKRSCSSYKTFLLQLACVQQLRMWRQTAQKHLIKYVSGSLTPASAIYVSKPEE